MGLPERGTKQELALEGIAALKAYFHSLGMPTTMNELEIPPEAYPQIADLTTENGTKTVPGFHPLTREDLLAIYRLAEA